MKLETTTQNILNSQDYHTMKAKVKNQQRDIEAMIQRLEQPRAGGLDNHFEEGVKYALKAVLGIDNSKEFNNACRWRRQIIKESCQERPYNTETCKICLTTDCYKKGVCSPTFQTSESQGMQKP